MSDLSKFLFELLEEAAAPLPGVRHRRMFGCDALFAEDNIFAIVWKAGRIALKLPDKTAYDELMARPGSDTWKAGEKVMGGSVKP